MKTIETIATISQTGEIQIQQPENLPVGKFRVVLVIDDQSTLPEESPATVPPENSFLAAAGDLIGCLADLPPDLSHNKAYLEGLGGQ